MKKADIGLIGLAVMGENLVMNMESKGFTVAVFNRTTEKVDKFVNGRAAGKNIIGCHSLEELRDNLEKPRKVFMMVKAGQAVDDFIEKLLNVLEPGDTRREYFLTLLGFAAVAVYLIVFLGVVPYGRTRVAVWLDPFADAKGSGWQNVQSLYAISSGGIFGAGFGNSRQKYMYISEPQNDFIFSVICEELGLVGAIIIILIFVTFIWRGFSLSVANTDRFQKFVGIGITSQIGYQMMLNIAVVTNMVPNTGISLPFFSSGGTSIVMLLAEIGVLLAISRESPNKVM